MPEQKLLSAEEIQNDFVDVLCAYPHRAAARLVVEKWRQHIAALEAKHARELSAHYYYAKQICESMAASYPSVPEWQPLGDLYGLLMQIDSMWVNYKDRPSAIRAEVEKLPHEAGCASLQRVHRMGMTHYETDGPEPCPDYHYEIIPCSCARGRALKLAGGE